MKRVVALIAALLICASFLIVPASAATLERSVSIDWIRGSKHYTGTISTPRFDSNTSVLSSDAVKLSSGTRYYTSIDQFLSDSEYTYEGAVGFYISFYFVADTSYAGSWGYQTPSYEGFYTNKYGQDGLLPSIDWDTFNPVSTSTYSSNGWTLKGQFSGTPDMPISALGFRRSSTAALAYWTPSAAGDLASTFLLVVPSASIVGVESTGELTALEGIADGIAAQSEILSAMYGDLISICNAIYERTGDMLEAQNLANQYFAQIIPLLNVISSNTGDIATTTSNIYSLLQTQFQLLISTINQESGEIQDAIDQAVDDLIAYLDSVFRGAVGELPSQNESTGGLITDYENAESDLFESSDDSFSQVVPEVPEFSSELIAAFALINTIFNSVWDQLGDFKFIFIFPLTLAVVLLAIGRISKFSGAGSRGGPKAPPGKGGNDGA